MGDHGAIKVGSSNLYHGSLHSSCKTSTTTIFIIIVTYITISQVNLIGYCIIMLQVTLCNLSAATVLEKPVKYDHSYWFKVGDFIKLLVCTVFAFFFFRSSITQALLHNERKTCKTNEQYSILYRC